MKTEADQKKLEYKRVVIKALTEEFQKPSNQINDDIRAYAKALEEGKNLKLTVLTGGLCNYSYKLQVMNYPKAAPALFVKLTFGTPILFPDTPCSIERTKNEFKMMETFAKITSHPNLAVTPYLLFDIDGSEENMKVIVTQFSRLSEQAANIFIDEDKSADYYKAYAETLAAQLAALNNTEVTEPNFNVEIKDFFDSLVGLLEMFFAGYLDDSNETPDRTALRGREMGKETLDKIIEVRRTIFRDAAYCYTHGDCHSFNQLVATPELQAVGGSNAGDICLIDWEFSTVGAFGYDIGASMVFPLACAVAHAVNGHRESTASILAFLDSLWETYAASIHLDDGKGVTLEDVYRNVLMVVGLYFSSYHGINVHCEYLPIDEGNPDDLAKVKDSIGVLSLEFYEIGFLGLPKDATLEELRKRFSDAIQKEVEILSPSDPQKPSRQRRSSMLRQSGRRVSDAHSYFSMASDVVQEVCSNPHDAIASKEFKVKFDLPECQTERKNSIMSLRQSIALVDLKRHSIKEWDRVIDWDDFLNDDDDEEEDGELM